MNELDSTKTSQTLIIATAGHVDHGKTALVKHLTGVNTDTLAEEKNRGLTINLGYAYHHFTSNTKNPIETTLGFVDVPGHTDFINNMLAGVGSVDFALLVVAADDGIMPQTEEHLAVLDLLGIQNGAVALTKTDRVDADQIDAVTLEIRSLLESTSLKNAPVFPVSNISGEGISQLREYLEKVPENIPRDTYAHQRKTRYLIDRSFTVKGIGTIVTGAIKTGTVNVGDSFLNSKNNETVRIKSLRLDETEVPFASAGQRVAASINLDQDQVDRGTWLVDPSLANPANRLDVQIKFLEASLKIRSSAQYHLHIGASHRLVSIRCLETNSQLFQLKLNSPIFCHYGDRFVLRDPASTRTIGGGVILDTFVPRKQRASAERLSYLKSQQQDDSATLKELLSTQSRGVDTEQFMLSRNINEDAMSQLLDSFQSEFISITISKQNFPTLIGIAKFRQFRETILSKIALYHHEHANLQGINESALSSLCGLPGSYQLFQGFLSNLISEGDLKLTGTLLHSPSHSTRLSREEEDFLAKVRPLLLKSGNVPPRTRELVELTGIDLAAMERILKQSSKSGSLVRVASNRHYLPQTLFELAEFTESLANDEQSEEGFSVIQFRDKTGIGRNLCIEILEYFDSVGFTRRDGNSRFVRTAKENIFT